MDGHGAYIWPSYAAAAFLLIGLLVASVKSLKKSKKDLSMMEQITNEGKNR